MRKKIKKIFQIFGLDISIYNPVNYQWITNQNISTVLDIGANTGQFALKISKILPHAKIFSFEPIEACYLELIKNTKILDIEVFQFALGEKEYCSTINVSAHTPSSSLLDMDLDHKRLFTHTAQSAKQTIQVKRLDSVLIAEKLNQNILVKIDVQGFEAEVLKGGLEVISMAKIIIIEINYYKLYKNQTSFHEIYIILNQLNFRFAGNLNQTFNQETGDIVYSDSIFIKN